MPTKKLITHLNHHCCTSDFTDVIVVFAMHEHRLTKAKKLVWAGDKRKDMLRDEIKAHKAQIHRDTKTKEVL
jgi:hypothetical protein